MLRVLLAFLLFNAAAADWTDEASASIANLALNATQTFLRSRASASASCPACLDLRAADLASLQTSYRKAASTELQRHAAALMPTPQRNQKQVYLRIQQDPSPSVAEGQHYQRAFNRGQYGITVSFVSTPRFTSLSQVDYLNVTMPADIRWVDVSGTGSDQVPAPDPTVLFHPWLMYYRTDILAANKMSPPDTWEGLLEAARVLNGTDFDNDGQPEYPVCFNSNYHCQQGYMLLQIFSSFLQTGSTMQAPTRPPNYSGVWFNATTMEPLVNNAAMRRALEIYRQLAAYTSPVPDDECLPYSIQFGQGKCVFAFNMEQIRLATDSVAMEVLGTPCAPVCGNLGVSLPPGSHEVLDPASDTLLPCNATLCPFGHDPPTHPHGYPVNHAPVNIAIRTHFLENNETTVEALAARYTFFQYGLMDWATNYVGPIVTALGIRTSNNSAPAATPVRNPPAASPSYSPRNSATGNGTAPAAAAAAQPGSGRNRTARRLMAVLPAAGPGNVSLLGVGVGGWPYNAAPLVEKGVHPGDAVEFLKAIQLAWSHNNTVMDIFIPGSIYYRLALGQAATNATDPLADLAAVAETLSDQFRGVVGMFNKTDPVALQKLYWQCMAYKPQDAAVTPRGLGHTGGSSSDWKAAYTAAVVVSVVVVLMMLMVLAILVVRARHKGRTLMGAVIAPGVGDATTLLITDIQNSTVMWEQLSMDLMSEVLRVHHATLRGLLDRHNGYESATEGDSFILAFHRPGDALAYAVEAQQALLSAPWPQQLLDNYLEAREIESITVRNNPDVELSYVIRRLQDAEAPLNATSSLPTVLSSSTSVEEDYKSPAARLKSLPKSAGSGLKSLSSATIAAARKSKLFGWVEPWWQDAFSGGSPTKARRGLQTDDRTRSGAVSSPGGSFAVGVAQDGEGEEMRESEGRLGLPSMTHVGTDSTSFGAVLSQAWVTHSEVNEAGRMAGLLLAPTTPTWRGVRVRMGIHSGLKDPQGAAYNKASRRWQYSGSFAEVARVVSDAAHGGQVLMTEQAFTQLKTEDRASWALVMMMGEFEFPGQQPLPLPLYQAVPRVLGARLRSFPDPRGATQVAAGVLAAPVGTASVVFMKATGIAMLTAWNCAVTEKALQLYHSTASELVHEYSGYVVEMAEGLSLVAFQRPEHAIAWALAVQATMLAAEWPEELLRHELGEPITTTTVVSAPAKQLLRSMHVHSRGLRFKVGIATGLVVDSVDEATGQMSYRGKVMNRASRIASAASTGQVLVHHQTWALAEASHLVRSEGITATSTGRHGLKGIRHPIELCSCTYISKSLASDLERQGSAPLPWSS